MSQLFLSETAVWKYVGIDNALDLLRGGFHLFHLYIKIKKKTIEDLNIH